MRPGRRQRPDSPGMAAASDTGSRRPWTRRYTSFDLVRRAAAVSRPLTVAAGALVVLSGLLPTAFSLATGALAGALPDAVGRGMGSDPGRRVLTALVVATVVYVSIQVVEPMRAM